MRFPARLVDLTGDGRLDLVGTLPHYYSPGGKLGGIVCIPQVTAKAHGELEFSEMVRLRYKQSAGDDQSKHFMGPYLVADVVDELIEAVKSGKDYSQVLDDLLQRVENM